MGTYNKLDQVFNTDIFFQNDIGSITGRSISNWKRIPKFNGTTLNYIWKIDSSGSTLKVIADYTKNTMENVNLFSSVYSDTSKNSDYMNNSPSSTDIYSLQADYKRVLRNKIEIKSGVKFSSIKRDNLTIREDYNNGSWMIDPLLSNHFIYNERLKMIYSSLEKNIGRTSIKLGLRVEGTSVDGNLISSNQQYSRDYLGLFPSIFINHILGEDKGYSVRLNYVRRLQRPAFTDLNPYILQIDKYTILKGNPDLLPEYTNRVELGTTLFNEYSADIYVQSTSNTIATLPTLVGGNIIEYQPNNFNNSTQYGFDLKVPFMIMKYWTVTNAMSVYNLSYSIGEFSIKQTTFYGKSIQSIVLKKLIDIDVIADYRSPYVYANSRIPDMFSFDLSFGKKLPNNKGRVRLYISDLFNTLRDSEVTDYLNTHIDFYQKRPTRTVSLSLTYNFSSGKKFNNKKIEQNNAEEKSRIGN